MKEIPTGKFYNGILNFKDHAPLSGQLELTYRCSFKCLHCYCLGSENAKKELSTKEWKKIIDMLYQEGCIFLTLTGGDPLLREDFFEIYSYARLKGFIITIFTNAYLLDKKAVDCLLKSPPFAVEVTINATTEKTYEKITSKKGAYKKVMENIRQAGLRGLPLIIKSNCLTLNKNEIAKVKKFTEELLGKKEHVFKFKYDPMVYPRLNGDLAPTKFRLSFAELKELRKQDRDIWDEFQLGIKADIPEYDSPRELLYRCNSWMKNFFINPYGRLKFCMFSDKFSVDVTKDDFKQCFYGWLPQIMSKKFTTPSKCKDCSLRVVCYHCPGRALLETGSEEKPVKYFCDLAKAFNAEKSALPSKK